MPRGSRARRAAFARPSPPPRLMSRRLFGPIVFWPAVAGLAAAAGWASRRWGFGVRHVERERRRVPTGPAVPVQADPDVRTADDGVGSLFHRRYRIDVAGATATPEEVIAAVIEDFNAFSPTEIAHFERETGEGPLSVGDDLLVHIASPWNGPVRVAEITPTSITLATREGHLESGSIRFSAARHPTDDTMLRFTIESWARSSDAVVDVVYDTLGVAKGIQGAMWGFFCTRVAETFGEPAGDVEVLTEREADDDATPGATSSGTPDATPDATSSGTPEA